MKQKKYRAVSALLIFCLLFTGCWDKIEINQRSFVVALGIDLKDDLYQVTYATPNLPVLTGQGGNGEKNFIKETQGKTILEANKMFNNISDLKLTFDHTKIIALGKDMLKSKSKLKGFLDYIDRSSQYAQSLTIVATEGSAKDLLESSPNSDQPTGVFINQMFTQSLADVSNEKVSFNNFVSALEDSKGNAKLPLIKYKDGEIQFDGIVLLKDYVWKYKVNTEQLLPINWVKGNGKGTIVQIEYENNPLLYQISFARRKVKFTDTGNGLNIDIYIEVEGDIDEYKLTQARDVFKNSIISDIEKQIKKEMEEKVYSIIGIAQQEVGFDIFELSAPLKMQYGKLWEKIKDHWEEYFTSAVITVDIQPHVRRIGMSK